MEYGDYLIGFAHAYKYGIDYDALHKHLKALEKRFDKTGLRTCPCKTPESCTFNDICPCLDVHEMMKTDGYCRCRIFVRERQ